MTTWSTNIARGVLVTVRRMAASALRLMAFDRGDPIRFRKYRVAPRLGTNTVRQRLMRGLYAHARLTATETRLA